MNTNKIERAKKEYTKFNENLKYFREKNGYTAKELSQLIGIPNNTYTAYETKNREPSFAVLIKIANALNVTIDELLDNTGCRREQEQKMTEQLGVIIGLMKDNMNTMKELLKIIETEQNKRVNKILEDTTARIDKTLDSHKLSFDDFHNCNEILARQAVQDFDAIMRIAGIKDKKE